MKKKSLAETRARMRSKDLTVARYARDAAAWQSEQTAWLRANAAEFRVSLES